MSLDQLPPICIHRDAHCFAGLRRTTFSDYGAMNKNVPALLCIAYAKLADFRAIMSWHMQQSPVANLPTHLRVTRRPVEHDVNLFGLIARQNSFDDRFRFK